MMRYALLTLAAALAAVSPTTAQEKKNTQVVIDTSLGKIKVELYQDKAPITVKNFLRYTDEKFYDGTIFHRVIPDFMIQGGGFKPGLGDAKTVQEIKAKEKDTHAPIKNEAPNGVSNKRGTIAMARTDDPDSATAQFFLNVEDNSRLDPLRYCAFGNVVEGMDVVDMIKGVKTRASQVTNRLGRPVMENIPVQDVVIRSIRRVE
jgi:cyclophilin family peptidyl-prolyl cis-trans isomerase